MNTTSKAELFVFTRYEANWSTGLLQFQYEVVQEGKHIPFVERWQLKAGQVLSDIPPSVLEAILQALHLIIGVSYYKAYCPKTIKIDNYSLSKEQAEFWNTTYTKGLGEFFYKNQIDFHNLIQFPFDNDIQTSALENIDLIDRALVLHGGGKDSIVTADIVRKSDTAFDLFCLNPKSIQEDVARRMNKNILTISRRIDPSLLELNKSGSVYNGHVPISTFYTFAAVLQAILGKYRHVVISSERSSSFGNVSYLGEEMNHQWSKSDEAEKLFRDYISTYISPDVIYFSMLRPWYEIKVAEKFSKLESFFDVFSSSNHNFKLDAVAGNQRWEFNSPKTIFVFTLLSAFVSKEDINTIFGDNAYNIPTLLSHFEQLLGLESIKPFECVGTPEEMMVAMKMAYDRGEYNDSPAMQLFENKVMNKGLNFNDMKKEVFSDGDMTGIPEKFRRFL